MRTFLGVLSVVILTGWLTGCATAPRPSGQMPAGLVPLNSMCQQYAMDCRWDGTSQAVTITYQGGKARAMVGSRVLMMKGRRSLLSVPLRWYKGMVMVPADLAQLIVGPVTVTSSRVSARVPEYTGTVVIDAGHGGKDPGAIGYSRSQEKELTLDLARRVKDGLTEAGVDVVLTRSNDAFISLHQRTVIAAKPGVELFVSIHANANKSRRANGLEVYYSAPLSYKDRVEDARIMNEKGLCSGLKMKDSSADVRRIVLDMLKEHKEDASEKLARNMAKTLPRAMACRSRGFKTARFYVLRNTIVPAVLIETGFISNPAEERKLKNSFRRQQLADAITQQILEYLNDSSV